MLYRPALNASRRKRDASSARMGQHIQHTFRLRDNRSATIATCAQYECRRYMFDVLSKCIFSRTSRTLRDATQV